MFSTNSMGSTNKIEMSFELSFDASSFSTGFKCSVLDKFNFHTLVDWGLINGKFDGKFDISAVWQHIELLKFMVLTLIDHGVAFGIEFSSEIPTGTGEKLKNTGTKLKEVVETIDVKAAMEMVKGFHDKEVEKIHTLVLKK